MSSIVPLRFAPDHGADQRLYPGEGGSLAVTLDFNRPRVRDWSNQELADLARVQSLLSRAGVPLDTDRGLTDEGDPWFVFCDAQGEVFVHICRLGMTYLLDGPSLDAPLRGASFDALVQAFIDRAATRVAAINAVPLVNKGDKVYLHPAMLLTALIWSLFLLNDAMTNAAYAAALDHVDVEQERITGRDLNQAFQLLADALDDNREEPASGLVLPGPGERSPAVQAGSTGDKLPSTTSVFHPTIIASLSAIALACGLLPSTQVSAEAGTEWSIVGNTKTVGASDTPTLVAHSVNGNKAVSHDEQSTGTPNHQDGEGITVDGNGAHLPLQMGDLQGLAAFVDFLTNNQTAEADAGTIAANSTSSTGTEEFAGPIRYSQPRTGSSEFDIVSQSVGIEPSAIMDREAAQQQKSHVNVKLSDVSIYSDLVKILVHLADDNNIHIVSADNYKSASKSSPYYVDAITFDVSTSKSVKSLLQSEAPVLAPQNTEISPLPTVDIVANETPTTALPPVTVTVPVPEPIAVQYDKFDADAQSFVDYLLAKQKNVLVIQLKSEIVIIDNSALDNSYDVAFAHSWTLADGDIVSTVGHYADYVKFDIL